MDSSRNHDFKFYNSFDEKIKCIWLDINNWYFILSGFIFWIEHILTKFFFFFHEVIMFKRFFILKKIKQHRLYCLLIS